MKIKIVVTINGIQKDEWISEMVMELPENMITLHSIEQMVSDFISDRLILAGYPKRQKE